MFGAYLCGDHGFEFLGAVAGPDMMRAMAQSVRLFTRPDETVTYRVGVYGISRLTGTGAVNVGVITWESEPGTVVYVMTESDAKARGINAARQDIRTGGGLLSC